MTYTTNADGWPDFARPLTDEEIARLDSQATPMETVGAFLSELERLRAENAAMREEIDLLRTCARERFTEIATDTLTYEDAFRKLEIACGALSWIAGNVASMKPRVPADPPKLPRPIPFPADEPNRCTCHETTLETAVYCPVHLRWPLT